MTALSTSTTTTLVWSLVDDHVPVILYQPSLHHWICVRIKWAPSVCCPDYLRKKLRMQMQVKRKQRRFINISLGALHNLQFSCPETGLRSRNRCVPGPSYGQPEVHSSHATESLDSGNGFWQVRKVQWKEKLKVSGSFEKPGSSFPPSPPKFQTLISSSAISLSHP